MMILYLLPSILHCLAAFSLSLRLAWPSFLCHVFISSSSAPLRSQFLPVSSWHSHQSGPGAGGPPPINFFFAACSTFARSSRIPPRTHNRPGRPFFVRSLVYRLPSSNPIPFTTFRTRAFFKNSSRPICLIHLTNTSAEMRPRSNPFPRLTLVS